MLALSHSAISKAIREKKKKMMMSEPEMVGTSPTPDMNAQDVYDIEQDARVESTLMSPEKINADVTNAEEGYQGVGLSPEEKMRMVRLRKYMDTIHLNGY
jgi:hypothetical protein